MSYSTDPVYDASRYYDEASARQQREDDHQQWWQQLWVDEALRSTSRPCDALPRSCVTIERGLFRQQTLAESMEELLQYEDFAQRAMDYIAMSARKDPVARKLLDDMGRLWAGQYAPEYEDD